MVTGISTRYTRNIGTISEDEQQLLAAKSVCVVGCGGLGGGIIEGLVRIGVGRLTVIDGDVFDETNLNRQVLSNQDNLGHAKAVEAKLQMRAINDSVQVDSIQVAETIKLLLGKEETLAGRLLTIDLLNQEYEIIEL